MDPILDDEYYLKKYNDLHFVTDIFPINKNEKMTTVLDKLKYNTNNRCIITSKGSPQFAYIDNILKFYITNNFSVFITNHPNIKDHPDVAPNSLHMITTVINNLLNNISYDKNLSFCLK